jgi:hypothetical protein
MLKAYLHPKKKPNDRHWYAYDLVFAGEKVVSDSRDPDHDLARALLARGINGKVTLHDRNTGKARTIIDIEKTAHWCAGSNLERYKWKAPPFTLILTAFISSKALIGRSGSKSGVSGRKSQGIVHGRRCGLTENIGKLFGAFACKG